MKCKNSSSIIYSPIIFAFVLVLGMFLGNLIATNRVEKKFTIYPHIDKLSLALDIIEENYVDKITKKSLIETTIPIVLEELDPHSIYIPAKDLPRVREPLEGNFEGIGVQFNIQNDTVLIVSTIPNGPSDKIGIKAGDRIVYINDSLFVGKMLNSDYVIKKLKGAGGSVVKVGIARRGTKEILDFKITRGKIPIYSVEAAYMIDDLTGYIKISRFARTSYREFIQAIKKLKKQGLQKIIIDLQSNTGGYLDAATRIADEFLEKGKLIVYTEGKARERENYYATANTYCSELDVAILLDSWSASASEILAGAIQDNDRGIIVGQRSFGKGLVQEPTFFRDSSVMRLTIARYYTPTGRCIQKPYTKGNEEYFKDIKHRYENGEFISADSIHFIDSLKYTTPKGKMVYGGGGIMPDYFVPIDTCGNSPYLNKVRRKSLIYKFALEFADNNRKTLNKFSDYKEFVFYLKNRNILAEFIKYAERKGVEANKKDIATSKKIIEIQIMAYIARNIIDNQGFYPIIKDLNPALLEAVKQLK